MKKLTYLISFIFIACCIASCTKDVSDSFDQEAQFKSDTTTIRNFVAKNDIPVLKLEKYGIFYQIIAPGTGNLKYTADTKITVNYSGKLLNGTTFDSSPANKPYTEALGNLITGWQIGVPLIQKGGKIRIFVPSYHGYGNRASGPIPANAILDFTLELLDATN